MTTPGISLRSLTMVSMICSREVARRIDLQHLIVDVLDGHVEIGTDARVAFHQSDQFVCDFIGIEVEKAQPEGLVDCQASL